VLAAAGLERLDLLDCVTEWLDPRSFVPAVAQGTLAVEARAGNTSVIDLAGALNDPDTFVAVRAERAFLGHLGGGCSLPVGAYATPVNGSLRVVGMVGEAGGTVVRGEYTGKPAAPEEAGVALAEDLLARGGRQLVEASEAGTV
jgi:hydroxymethylbilane synthase